MHNPPHPGGVIREFCLGAELTISKLAVALGVSRKTLSVIVNERGGISPEMACRLSKAFGDSPEMWLGMQMDYDLWRLRDKTAKLKVKRIAA
jgi:addiction module HigA family antidote